MVILDNCLYVFYYRYNVVEKNMCSWKIIVCTQNTTTVTTYMARKNIIVSSVILFSVGHQDFNLIIYRIWSMTYNWWIFRYVMILHCKMMDPGLDLHCKMKIHESTMGGRKTGHCSYWSPKKNAILWPIINIFAHPITVMTEPNGLVKPNRTLMDSHGLPNPQKW